MATVIVSLFNRAGELDQQRVEINGDADDVTLADLAEASPEIAEWRVADGDTIKIEIPEE